MKLSEMSKTEDLIQNVKDLYAMECHAQSAYRKMTEGMELLPSPTSEQETEEYRKSLKYYQESKEFYKQIQQEIKKLRYETYGVMNQLLPQEFDEHASCLFKHGAGVARRAEELIDSKEDKVFYQYMQDTHKVFNKITTKFLGLEIAECSTCVSEMTDKIEKGMVDNG